MSINKRKLAELIGIILGDGHLHKKANSITIVGSLDDFHYYESYVIPLIKSIFNVNPKLRKRNDRNAFYIDFNSKETMEYLIEEIGLKRGNKKRARLPNLIKNNKSLYSHFLRGFFDTDGTVKFSKQKKKINYYPRVEFCQKNKILGNEIANLIKNLGFNLNICIDKRYNTGVYQISGNKNLKRWKKVVGFSNQVHLTKYLVWERDGQVKPRTTLKERIATLEKPL